MHPRRAGHLPLVLAAVVLGCGTLLMERSGSPRWVRTASAGSRHEEDRRGVASGGPGTWWHQPLVVWRS